MSAIKIANKFLFAHRLLLWLINNAINCAKRRNDRKKNAFSFLQYANVPRVPWIEGNLHNFAVSWRGFNMLQPKSCDELVLHLFYYFHCESLRNQLKLINGCWTLCNKNSWRRLHKKNITSKLLFKNKRWSHIKNKTDLSHSRKLIA